jgi:hypothetical protein
VSANVKYAGYPDHPLHGVPQAVLDAGRTATREAAGVNDLNEVNAGPIADAVIQRALPELRKWLASSASSASATVPWRHLLHRWTQWRLGEIEVDSVIKAFAGKQVIQSRHCVRCNLMQVRNVRVGS